MIEAPPPIVISPELLAHMREQPDSELTRLARGYIQLALMLSGENELSNLEPCVHQLKPRLSAAQTNEIKRELQTINEKLERMITEPDAGD